MVTAKDYRPWEIPRLIGRCADCGNECTLTVNGLCQRCENKTRGNRAWAPALPPVTSERSAARPDGRAPSYTSWPTTEIAGSARFYGRSRDAW